MLHFLHLSEAAIFNELQARAPHPLPEYTKPLKTKPGI